MGKYIESEFISREIIVNIATEICKRRNILSNETLEAIVDGMEITRVFIEDKIKHKQNNERLQ